MSFVKNGIETVIERGESILPFYCITILTVYQHRKNLEVYN